MIIRYGDQTFGNFSFRTSSPDVGLPDLTLFAIYCRTRAK